jgi:hypothetical protein
LDYLALYLWNVQLVEGNNAVVLNQSVEQSGDVQTAKDVMT